MRQTLCHLRLKWLLYSTGKFISALNKIQSFFLSCASNTEFAHMVLDTKFPPFIFNLSGSFFNFCWSGRLSNTCSFFWSISNTCSKLEHRGETERKMKTQEIVDFLWPYIYYNKIEYFFGFGFSLHLSLSHSFNSLLSFHYFLIFSSIFFLFSLNSFTAERELILHFFLQIWFKLIIYFLFRDTTKIHIHLSIN